MKQTLLYLIALASAVCMSTTAWAIDPPIEVDPAFTTNWVAPEDGGVYFLYNVGADQYLGAGNHWGTHTITATYEEEGIIPLYFWDAGVGLSGSSDQMGAGMILPIKLTKTAEGTYYIEHMGSNRTACYLTSEDAVNGIMTNSWIDGDLSRAAKFNIVAVDGGYTIQATNTVQAGTYFGAADPEEEVEEGEPVVRNVMNNLTEGNIIWRFAPTNYVLCMTYDTRLAFYEKIIEAQDEGVSTRSAEALYNNASTTAAQMEAAMNALTLAINKAKFEVLLGGATPSDPIDATEYVLENPDFEFGNISGWTTNYKSGQQANNIGYQGASYTNGDVFISRFIEAWKNDSEPWTIGDGYLQQTVYGLPQGKYVLEADAISVYQWADHAGLGGTGKNPTEGVYLFIKAGQFEAKQALATGNGQPEHFSVTFINDGSDELIFGLKTENATANWIAADNFRIWYYGKTDLTPAQVELETAIIDAENVDTSVPANARVLTALENALENAQSVLDSRADDEACNTARETLTAAVQAFNVSVKAYEAFDEYVNGEFSVLLEQVVENENWLELADAMDNYISRLQNKLYNYTLTTEEAEGCEAYIQGLLVDFIGGDKIQAGDNLTLLLKNPDFENGLTGWTMGRGDAWTIFEGVDYHEVESWHQNFDLYQVIPNMPAGVYEISVQGFARLDDGLTETTIELYAGDSSTHFPSISRINGQGPDEYSEEILYDAASFGDTPIDKDGRIVYVPNGMAGAQVYFSMDNPLTGKPFYQREVKITLMQPGDLRIGVRSNSTHEWVLWDNMKIIYKGQSLELYYSMIQDAQEEMMQAVNAEGSFVTKAAADLVDALNARVDKMDELSTADEAVALITDLKAATEYIKAGRAKRIDLEATFGLYNELAAYTDSTDPAFPELLVRVEGQIADPVTVDSNEAVDGIIASFKPGWGTYVTFDAPDQPADKFDATPAIINYDYFHPVKAENSFEGWNIEAVDGAFAADFNELECWDNATFNVYQTIEGLKPGLYEITVQGYYRAGYAYYADYQNVMRVRNAYLYATTSVEETREPLLNAMDGAQDGLFGVGSETVVLNPEGREVCFPNNMEAAAVYFENECYPNSIKVQVGADGVLTIGVDKYNHIEGDWAIFTNWQLFYLGAGEEPTIKFGDANLDGAVDVVDVTTTVDFILGKAQPNARQFKSTDVNKDNTIDVVDLTSIVSIILGTYRPVAAPAKAPARIQTNDVLLVDGSDLALLNARQYVAFQMDVTLSDGAVLNGVQLSERAAGKEVTFHKMAGNTYRILVYSFDNSSFTGNEGTLLSLNIVGNQQATFSNVLFSDGTKAYTLGTQVATGINGLAIDAQKTAVYDLNGRRISNLKKGNAYLINGKTVLVK